MHKRALEIPNATMRGALSQTCASLLAYTLLLNVKIVELRDQRFSYALVNRQSHRTAIGD